MSDTPAQRQARYRANHPEKFTREARAESRKESDKKYRDRVGTHPMNKSGTPESIKYRSSERYRVKALTGHLKRHYGITLADYEGMFEAQGGKCQICGGTTPNRNWADGRIQRMKLFVDHCHETGKVRGLLCNTCNVGLASLKDSPDLLIKAAEYLRNSIKEI